MKNQTLESKIRASVLGAAFGDALGAPFEFNRPEWVCPHRLKEMWFDTLDCTGGNNVFGVWGLNLPAGTGTDDTRYNWLFLDIDCYACVTGALAGAATGIQALPAQAMEQVVNSNRQVYGIDLEKTIRGLMAILLN